MEDSKSWGNFNMNEQIQVVILVKINMQNGNQIVISRQ